MKPLRAALLAVSGAALLSGSAAQLGSYRVVAAGDIACWIDRPTTRTECHHGFTSDTVLRLRPDVVAALGDNQYGTGTDDWYRQYAPTWGRFKAITRPVPGNHEYNTRFARGYFGYYGDVAGSRHKPNGSGGYYAYSMGDWRVYALNSERQVKAGSPQLTWLARDMAAHPAQCTLAYWHRPLYNDGAHVGRTTGGHVIRAVQPLYDAFVQQGGDVILNGHVHIYEHLAEPGRTPGSVVRQFIVGTGGEDLNPLNTSRLRETRVRNADTFGVLALDLKPGGFAWSFHDDGHSGGFTDAGSAGCENP